jgi:hypothetical protein
LLRGLTSLRILSVHHTAVTEAGIKELGKALPKLKVLR